MQCAPKHAAFYSTSPFIKHGGYKGMLYSCKYNRNCGHCTIYK